MYVSVWVLGRASLSQTLAGNCVRLHNILTMQQNVSHVHHRGNSLQQNPNLMFFWPSPRWSRSVGTNLQKHKVATGSLQQRHAVSPFRLYLPWITICIEYSCDSCHWACWLVSSALQHLPRLSQVHTAALQSPPPCLEIPAQHVPSLHIQSSPSLHTPAHLLPTPRCSVDDRALTAAGPDLWYVKPRGLSQRTSVASSKVQTHLCRRAPAS